MPNLDEIRDLGEKVMDRLRKDPGPFDSVEMVSKPFPPASNNMVHTIVAVPCSPKMDVLRIGVGSLNPRKEPETLARAIRRMGEAIPAPKAKKKKKKG